jgi:cytochrome c553
MRNLVLLAVGLAASLAAQAQPDKHARNLAASCAACHGTNGNSVGGTPVLAGMDRALFVKQMKDFKSGARPATVMQQHARGYTDEEVDALADFFSSQSRATK